MIGITALLSFAGSFLPDIVKMFQDKSDKKHELAVMRLQMEMQEKGISAKFDEVAEQSYSTQMVAIQESYRKDIELSGKVMAIYSASVRPTITYALFFTYMAVRATAIHTVLTAGLPWQNDIDAVLKLMTPFDMFLLEGVFGFWFGGRVRKHANL